MRFITWKKFVLCGVIILLSVGYSFSQKIIISDTLIWNDIIFLKNEQNKVENFMSFKNYFQNNDNFLPVYRKKIKIPDGQEIKNLKIINLNFQVVDEIDKNLLTDVDKVPNDIKFDYGTSVFRKNYYAQIEFIPLRINQVTNQLEKLVSFEVQLDFKKKENEKNQLNFSNNSKLASGKWYKMKVKENGIYKLTYEQLKSMGFSDFNNIGIFGYGYMLPKKNNDVRYDDLPERNILKIDTNNDGVFNSGDYFLFYAEGPDKFVYESGNSKFKHEKHDYSDYAYYFVSDKGTWKSVATVNSNPSFNVVVNSYNEVKFLEVDSLNIINMGRTWYWKHFDFYTSYNFSFNIPNLITTAPIKFDVSVAARSTISSSFKIFINDVLKHTVSVDKILGSYNSDYAKTANTSFETYSTTPIMNVKLDYVKTTSASEGWLNFIRLNARCNLKLNGDFLSFRDAASVAEGNIAQYVVSNTNQYTRIWDITDPTNAISINVSSTGNEIRFNRDASSLREYIAFNINAPFLSPIIDDNDLGFIKNQNLHALPNRDLIIITYPEFRSQAEQLAQLHKNSDGIESIVVDVNTIYNEFSSGCPDITAIRDFVRMFYERATNDDEIPDNLLLLGDGSFDNKAPMGKNGNFVPTYQSLNSFSPSGAYVNDDFYVMLDAYEGMMSGFDDVDMGIGRIPVKSVSEAQNVVNKIIAYHSASHFGAWRNIMGFIGDDAEDSGIHQYQANELADKVVLLHPEFNVDKIFLDSYEQVSTVMGMRYPEVNKIIDDRVTKGCLLLNYTGHGNTKTLAHEIVVDLSQVNSWTNPNNFPIFVTATCEYSRFDDYTLVSAGEQILLNPKGGGIALFTTTRLVQSHSNFTLNKAFFDYFFSRDSQNRPLTMGQIIMKTKNVLGSDGNKFNFALLGDPALRPAIPFYEVVTESINGINVNEFSDTVGAKGRVVIKGFIKDFSGNKLTSFNGVVYPTVYDKNMDYVTRGNDGKPPQEFKEQMNVLFRGQTSVVNGEFEFSFIVPVDIAYFYGPGKISYYAHNYISDANGYNSDMIIGGTSNNAVVDNDGPNIKLFINNDDFVAGGITDENPKLIAYVSDSSGINTVGNGIGHDITAIIDGDTQKSFVLNEFYEANLNDYTSGKIVYQLSNLSIGPHTIKVKVWDVLNNSSETLTDFIVANSSELIIDQVFNYPNPFSTNTEFYFNHNQANLPLDVLIQIFTITGKLVTSIETTVVSDGFRSHPIKWAALDNYGDKLGKGVYLYKIMVKSPNGNIATKTEKLFILN